jgi:hypothetical protein
MLEVSHDPERGEHPYYTIERLCRDGFEAILVAKHGERESEIHLTNCLETKNFQQEKKKCKLSSSQKAPK